MPAPYSLDLRTRIVEAYHNDKGSITKIAKTFNVGRSTVHTYIKLMAQHGNPAAKKPSGGRPQTIDIIGMSIIRKYIERKPDITLDEISRKYYKKHKVKVSISIISRAL